MSLRLRVEGAGCLVQGFRALGLGLQRCGVSFIRYRRGHDIVNELRHISGALSVHEVLTK